MTGYQIAQTTLEAIKCKGGYIWGQSGGTWTQAMQDKLARNYAKDPEGMANYKYSVQYGQKWVGHRVWDCSGLTMWAAKQHGISYHHGSNSMWNYDMKYKGKLAKGMELPVGAYVYTGNDQKKPHIGTYTGDGLVTEAAGSNAGCIQTKLHGGKWLYWGLGKGIEYDFIPGQESKEDDSVKTLKRGSKGEEVRKVQKLLLERGYKLPKYGADGDFGAETEKAVKQFQLDWGLKQDGIVGPETLKYLENTPAKVKTYRVIVSGLTEAQGKKLTGEYPGSKMEEE